MTTRNLVVGVMTVAVAVACGSGSDTDVGRRTPAAAVATTAVDACSVLPKADLERALGAALGDAQPAEPFTGAGGRISTCAWRATDGSAGALVAVRQNPAYHPDPDAFSGYASGFEENLGARPEVRPISGLGSAAIWDVTNHVLLVRPSKAGYEISVQPYLSTKVPMITLEQARAVAEALLARL